MRPHTALFVSAAFGLIAFAAAFAQEQPTASEQAQTTEQTQPAAASPTPAPASSTAAINPQRGATMETVRAKFGTPSQEVPAVGTPPITRWEYPGYVVFFENDRVLHTVVVK